MFAARGLVERGVSYCIYGVSVMLVGEGEGGDERSRRKKGTYGGHEQSESSSEGETHYA